jgi:hypothetical protein
VNDIWVCADCRSINRMRDASCYRCRAPRSGAIETPSLDLRSENAVLERSTRSYVISWPLAGITAVLIVAVAILGLVILKLQVQDYPAMRQTFLDSIAGGRSSVDGSLAVESVQVVLLSGLRLGLALLALVCFAGWLALVARNVPLLGGGVPSRSPLRIFAYTLIPIWNLIKVPGIVQDLLYRVDPREGGAFMVMAAWIGLVGSWLVSLIGTWMITVLGVRALVPAIDANDTGAVLKAFGDVLDRSYWLGVVVEVMIAVGAILLVATMVKVESRCAARDREIGQRMGDHPAGLPAGPNWDADAAASGVDIAAPGVALAAATAAAGATTGLAPVPSVQPPAPTTAPGPTGVAGPAPVPSVRPPGPPTATGPAGLGAAAAAGSPAPYEPNWPTSRGWLGRSFGATPDEPPAPESAPGSPGTAPTETASTAPATDAAEPPSPPTVPPPPPPPGAPSVG